MSFCWRVVPRCVSRASCRVNQTVAWHAVQVRGHSGYSSNGSRGIPAHDVLDLRSDTVTKPTRAMREAMSSADVGDDVYGEDMTVRKLECTVADIFGKEAALFVPSGTQGNLISVLAHTWERGSEYVVGSESHIFCDEQGGPSQFGGAHPRSICNRQDGTMALHDIEAAIQDSDPHYAQTKLICLEDCHATCGGRVLPQEYIDSVGDLARERGVHVHVDGARVWNALVSCGIPGPRRYRDVASLSVCLSKGLGAPAGSVVVGDARFIWRARRLRKGLGGAMRQVGILAAAGIHALDSHFARLAQDHANAICLAEALDALPLLSVDVASVQTNIVMVDLKDNCPITAPKLQQALELHGVRCFAYSARRLRLVTHLEVTREHVMQAAAIFANVLQSCID